MLVEGLHEGIGIELFHVEDAFAFPAAGEEHLSADHGGHARGVGDRLRLDLAVTRLMVADVVDEARRGLAVCVQPLDLAADAGFALGQRAERGGVGQERLEELQRDDVDAVEAHGVDARHADIAQHLEVLEVVVREAHPEARALEPFDVSGQRFKLLVVHEIDVQ